MNAEPIRSELADDADMRPLLFEFASGFEGHIAAIAGALQNNDMATAATVAHQLKGAGGGYGYPQISDAGARLEYLIKTHGQADPDVWAAADELFVTLRRAAAGLS